MELAYLPTLGWFGVNVSKYASRMECLGNIMKAQVLLHLDKACNLHGCQGNDLHIDVAIGTEVSHHALQFNSLKLINW